VPAVKATQRTANAAKTSTCLGARKRAARTMRKPRKAVPARISRERKTSWRLEAEGSEESARASSDRAEVMSSCSAEILHRTSQSSSSWSEAKDLDAGEPLECQILCFAPG